MKKYLFSVFALFTMICLALTSCTKDDVEESTLALSTNACEFTNAAGDQSVAVTTNEEKWNAISNVEWVHAEAFGSTLTVKVDANESTKDRSAEILVIAGTASEKIEVRQSASDIAIIAVPEKLDVTQYDASYILDIKANSENWSAQSDVDWITANAKTFKGEVVVNVQRNPAKEDRMGNILLSYNGNVVKKLAVHQVGMTYYILPMMKPFATVKELRSFELDRRSLQLPEDLFGGTVVYETDSPVYNKIIYTLTDESVKAVKGITMYATSRESLEAADGAAKLLVENGFTKQDENTYTKETDAELIGAKFVYGDENKLVITYDPKQTKPQPTFDNFPYGNVEFGKATVKDIEEYEKTLHGVFNQKFSFSGYDTYYYFGDKVTCFSRAYAFAIPKNEGEVQTLSYSIIFYTDLDKFFYKVHNMYNLTNEFKQLLQDEGFELKEVFSGTPIYANKKKNIQTAIGIKNFAGGLKVRLELSPLKEKKSSSANNLSYGEIPVTKGDFSLLRPELKK